MMTYTLCDRPGCNNEIPEKDLRANLITGKPHVIWYRLKVIDNSGGWKDWDFCSLDCIQKQIWTNQNVLKNEKGILG